MSYRLFAGTVRGAMSQSSRNVEGVFAVHKPHGISSYDVLRRLKNEFRESRFFKSWLADERERLRKDPSWKRRKGGAEIKIGHGGTLDPIATGVLITGVGRGTKELGRFLECSKTYETVVLFGVATDSYDCVGKVTTRAPYEHVTREAVEKALEQFRGQIMQKPSMFSALKVKGKKLYEYAREGKEPPIEIAKRPVEVHNLEIMDWYEGGTHEYKWPEEEAEENVKMVAEKLLHKELGSASPATDVAGDQHAQKRKSSPELTSETGQETTEQPPLKRTRTDQDDSTPAAAEAEPATASKPPAPPAVKLRMTVSSGFYVRSLAHDLGLALGSNAIMSSLVRKRQGDFDISPENILEYKDLDGGEEVWGPKLQGFLDKWVSREAARKEQEKEEDVRDAERRFRRNTSSDEG